MQKSKKMMVSLCGLALSSLFVLNNKSVVRADTVGANNQNNNAISWDSDSDQAQQVQNDSEQSFVQNTQVVDNNQPNQVSATNSRAETSTVRSSSAALRTITNQSAVVQSPHVANVQDAQAVVPVVINNPAGDKVNVHYVNRDGGAITDPNVKDTTIDVTKTGQGSYQVLSGYNVNNPDGKYTISGGAFNGASLKGNTWTVPDKYSKVLTTGNDLMDTALTRLGMMKDGTTYSADASDGNHQATVEVLIPTKSNDVWDGYKGYRWHAGDGNVGADGVTYIGGGTWYTDPGRARGPYNEQYYFGAFPKSPSGSLNILVNESPHKDVWNTVHSENKLVESAHIEQQLPVAFVDNNNNIVGMVQNYTGKVGTSQNISLSLPTGYKLADGQTMPTSVTFANNTKPLLIKVAPNGQTNAVENPANNTINVKFVDQESGQQVGTTAIDLTKTQQGTNYYQTPQGYAADVPTYDVNSEPIIGLTGFSTIPRLDTNESIVNDLARFLYNDYSIDYSADKVKKLSDYLNTHNVDLTSPSDVGEWHLVDETDDRIVADVSPTSYALRELSKILNDKSLKSTQDWHKISNLANYTFIDNYHTISNGTVTVPVHKSNSKSFIDNSGNAVSSKGNTVDVVLTKKSNVDPSKVDPNSPGYKITHSEAVRSIHVNFPDNQIPVSYKNIVDSKGDLIQTVHFTRDATVDTLLDPSDPNYVISEGAWKSDNKDPNFIGFPERTLPRIPGYTLSIKPA